MFLYCQIKFQSIYIINQIIIHMTDISHPYTEEELYNNYEFKVIKKALMREYPWIKDVTVTSENLNRYNLIFLDVDVDPIKLGEDIGLELTPWVKRAYENGKEYHAMYLSLLFPGVENNATTYVTRDIEELINSVGKSPAFPSELRIKGGRRFAIGDFWINKGSEPW